VKQRLPTRLAARRGDAEVNQPAKSSRQDDKWSKFQKKAYQTLIGPVMMAIAVWIPNPAGNVALIFVFIFSFILVVRLVIALAVFLKRD
jgi:hypothetical protein